MIKKKFFWGVLIFLLGGLFMASCTKNDESTIVLIGTEDYIDDIVSVIPDSLQDKFFAAFGNIPEGPVPPKIDGSYIMNPKQRVASNVTGWPLDIVEQFPVYLRFSGQHNGVVELDLAESTETLTDTVFVQGSGQNFTVYFVEDKVIEDFSVPVSMKRGIIMKGRVTDEGLADFRYATIVKETDDELDMLPQPGSYYIYKDGDGTASSYDW